MDGYNQGRLTTTSEIVVRIDPQTRTIFIDPANQQMVYVPVYDSEVVYGTWRYPDYPPDSYYYPGYSSYPSTLSFLAGILIGSDMGWGGWNFDWGRHRSNIQVGNYNNFVSRSYASPDQFRINSASGATVAYNTQFRNRFSGQQAAGATTARSGVSGARNASQAQPRSSATTVGAAVTRTPSTVASSSVGTASVSTAQPQVAKTAVTGNPHPAASTARVASRSTESVTAFSGAGNGANVRAASFRGQSSLQSSQGAGASNAGVVSQRSGGASRGAVSQGEARPANRAPASPGGGGGISAGKEPSNSNGKEKR